MRLEVTQACGLPDRDPDWRARWIAASFLEREAMHEAERSRGLVTAREPDFSLSVAPEYFWPPGHVCNGGAGMPPAAWAAPVAADPAPVVGLGALDPRRLWEALKNALTRLLGNAQLALIAALALAAGLAWLLFGRRSRA